MISQGRGGRIIGKCRLFPSLLRITYYISTHENFHTGACSGAGKQGYTSLGAYSSSKFGVRALTQCAGAPRPILLSLPSAPVLFARLNVPGSKLSSGIRCARHYRQRLFSRTRQDSVVYVSSTSLSGTPCSNTYQGMVLWPQLVLKSRIM